MKYCRLRLAYISGFLLLFNSLTILAIDNAHWWRATNMLWYPELDKDFFSYVDATLSGGATSKGRDHEGFKVPLFNIYGLNDMHDLGVNVPKDLSTTADLILTQLALTQSRDTFANLSIDGHFSIVELNLLWTQHLICNTFFQVFLPVRRFSINNICIRDCSPIDDGCPNRQTPIWQTFLQQFPAILAQHQLSAAPFNGTGVGDLTILVGAAYNYNDTTALDFIDISAKTGVLIPTGKKKNPDNIFSLPFGYNGHVGIPFALDIAVGSYEWLMLGAHFDAVTFIPNNRCMRFQTAPFQQGFIELAKSSVHENMGTVWTAGAYAKADHFCRNISLLLGYTFARQNRTELSLPCNNCFDVVCNDQQLQGWRMHTLHVAIEYDQPCYNSDTACHIGLFSNIVLTGSRIWDTTTGGIRVGCNIGWVY